MDTYTKTRTTSQALISQASLKKLTSDFEEGTRGGSTSSGRAENISFEVTHVEPFTVDIVATMLPLLFAGPETIKVASYLCYIGTWQCEK